MLTRDTKSFPRRLALLVMLALALAAEASGAHAKSPSAYRLEIGDRVTVTVFGQPQLSGDVVVDGGGNVVLPLINSVPVANLTLDEAQDAIRARLADGILNQPAVSLRIAELRPVYVLGDVRKPGAYPFRFGMTVNGIVALAGGFGAQDVPRGDGYAEYLAATERLRQLENQKAALQVRTARLEAQLAGKSTFTGQLENAKDQHVAAATAIEKSAFQVQTDLLNKRLAILSQQKPPLAAQIEAITRQVAAATSQLEMVTKQQESYERLVNKGLGTSSAHYQLKFSQSTQELQIWRMKADISRLRMEAADLDFKIQETRATFVRQTSDELRAARERLLEIEVALPIARELHSARLKNSGAVGSADFRHSIVVTRIVDGTNTAIEAANVTLLQPGDTVEVVRLLPVNRTAASAGPALASAIDAPSPTVDRAPR